MAEELLKNVLCPTCGRGNPPQNRFCGFCGASMPAAPVTPPAPVAVSLPPAARPSSVSPVAPAPVVASAPGDVAAPVVDPSPLEIAAMLSASAAIAAKPAPPRTGPNVPPPVPANVRAAKRSSRPATELAIPAEPLMREREREKLLTQASAFRVKGQVTDARETLQQAVRFYDNRPGQEIAAIYEQIGDLLETEDFSEEAREAYGTAFELDPKRVSADRKRAALTLALADRKNPDAMSAALMRGESIADVLSEGPVTRRNAGLAMFLSIVFPGFGQLYNTQILKGLILMAIAVISLLVISASAEKDALFHNIAALFALRKGGAPPSPLMIFSGLAYFAAWLYSIVDAPFFSGKAGGESVEKSTVDKSGWEV